MERSGKPHDKKIIETHAILAFETNVFVKLVNPLPLNKLGNPKIDQNDAFVKRRAKLALHIELHGSEVDNNFLFSVLTSPIKDRHAD